MPQLENSLNQELTERVGFGTRLVASILNFIIILILSIVLGSIFGGAMSYLFMIFSNNFLLKSLLVLAGSIGNTFIFLYILGIANALLEGFTGASIGKRCLRIKIATAEGQAAGTIQLLIRIFLTYFFSMCYMLLIKDDMLLIIVSWGYALLFIISCLFIFGESKQALHDRLLGTAVYRVPKLADSNVDEGFLFQRSGIRIAFLFLIVLVIPLTIIKTSPEILFSLLRKKQGVEEISSPKKTLHTVSINEMLLVKSAQGEALIDFTQIDDGESMAEYRWRYWSYASNSESSGKGLVFEPITSIISIGGTEESKFKRPGRKEIHVGDIVLEWSLGGKNLAQIRDTVGGFEIETLHDSEFTSYPFSTRMAH